MPTPNSKLIAQAVKGLFTRSRAGSTVSAASAVRSVGDQATNILGQRLLRGTKGVRDAAAGAVVPTLTTAGVGLGVAEIVEPVVDGLSQDIRSVIDPARDYKEALKQRRIQVLMETRLRRLSNDTQANAQLLAKYNPQLFNELLAGATLPPGSVVIGGGKRTDLVTELALQMATGEHTPQRPDDELAQLLGGGVQ